MFKPPANEDDQDDDDYPLEDLDPDELDALTRDAEEDPNNATQAEEQNTEEAQEEEEPRPGRRSARARNVRIAEPTDIYSSTWQSNVTNCQRGSKWQSFETQMRVGDQKWKQLEKHHNFSQSAKPVNEVDYELEMAMVMARFIVDIHHKATTKGASFAQQYILQKGLKKFGPEGRKAAIKEADQLHKRTCFTPISVADLTPEEKRKAQEALMFLCQKRDGTHKGRMVYNGAGTRDWLRPEDARSPTCSLESLLLLAMIDAKELRDVMTADIPNAFIQAHLPQGNGEERVIMKITGVLVDLMVEMEPEVYGPYVVYENGRKVLYVQVLRALYGMLIAALRWYQTFKADLESIGFEFNPYDPCVANRTVRGKQHTVRFHVDDLMSSHADPKVNDRFLDWLNKKYGNYGEVTATRRKIHDYLGMIFDFSEPGILKLDMIDYVEKMLEEFSLQFDKRDTVPTPAEEDLFHEGKGHLDKERQKEFHTFVAKGLFACKRARPDIHQVISVLCTRTKSPNGSDWNKLVHMMRYLNGTRKDKLYLSIDDIRIIKWWVDASFAVHPDFKSHTGSGMSWGRGFPINNSGKQKLNSQSSTVSELIGAETTSTMALWTKLFVEAQGYNVERNIIYQDNKSAILLEVNGKASSSKRTRAINIRYFFMKDQIAKGNLEVIYCPTDEMTADYQTKPLQGHKFKKFKARIMGWE